MKDEMKRSLLLVLLLSVLTVSAKDNPLRLQNGSLLPLKNSGGFIFCELDFSNTKGNKKPLAEYLEEDLGSSVDAFNNMAPDMLGWFTDRWDKDIKKGPKTTANDNAEFLLNIVIKNIVLGSNSGFGAASISGKAEFYYNGEEEPFAVVEILKMNGTILGGGLHGFVGLRQAFNDLADYLCKMINNARN